MAAGVRPDLARRDASLNQWIADAVLSALGAGIALELVPHGERLRITASRGGRQELGNVPLPPTFRGQRAEGHRAALGELERAVVDLVARFG